MVKRIVLIVLVIVLFGGGIYFFVSRIAPDKESYEESIQKNEAKLEKLEASIDSYKTAIDSFEEGSREIGNTKQTELQRFLTAGDAVSIAQKRLFNKGLKSKSTGFIPTEKDDDYVLIKTYCDFGSEIDEASFVWLQDINDTIRFVSNYNIVDKNINCAWVVMNGNDVKLVVSAVYNKDDEKFSNFSFANI